MYYIPLLIVCSLSPGYVGDKDAGATCLKFSDALEVHYYRLSDCETRVREIQQEVFTHKDRLAEKLPGPWHFRGRCIAPVLDEKET